MGECGRSLRWASSKSSSGCPKKNSLNLILQSYVYTLFDGRNPTNQSIIGKISHYLQTFLIYLAPHIDLQDKL